MLAEQPPGLSEQTTVLGLVVSEYANRELGKSRFAKSYQESEARKKGIQQLTSSTFTILHMKMGFY